MVMQLHNFAWNLLKTFRSAFESDFCRTWLSREQVTYAWVKLPVFVWKGYIFMRIFGAPFFRLGDLIQWMMWPNKNSPQITRQHRWRSKTLWNELRNSDSTNPLSSSRFQLAPPQTKRWRKNTKLCFKHVWFWLLAYGFFGARPYTSSFFFSFGRATLLPTSWRHLGAPCLLAALPCSSVGGTRAAGFVVGLVLWSGWQKTPNDWPKMGSEFNFTGFSIFFWAWRLRGPVWSCDFKICKWSVLFGHWMSQEEVVGATTKAKSEVSSNIPSFNIPWMSMVILND